MLKYKKPLILFLQLIFLIFVIRFFIIKEPILALYQIGFAISAEIILLIIKRKIKTENLKLILWILIIIHEIGLLKLYEIPGFDTLLHLSWSILLGFIFSKYFSKLKYKGNKLTLVIIFLMLLIGILWEMTEFSWDLLFEQNSTFGKAQPNILDTVKDLLSNILGALIGHQIAKRPNRQNPSS